MAELKPVFSTFPVSVQNLLNLLISGQNIEKIVLFGSRARGTARENSDYDFAIWIKDRPKWNQQSQEIEEKNLTLLPIDLAVYSELSAEYRSNIDREGIVVYD